jgi:chromosome segregation ATPase
MIEPGEDNDRQNLLAAVSIGQRLLKRNQDLLEEQLVLQNRIAELEKSVAGTTNGKQAATELAERHRLETRMFAAEKERDSAQRKVNTLLDVQAQSERRIATMQSNADLREQRDKETIASLQAQVKSWCGVRVSVCNLFLGESTDW